MEVTLTRLILYALYNRVVARRIWTLPFFLYPTESKYCSELREQSIMFHADSNYLEYFILYSRYRLLKETKVIQLTEEVLLIVSAEHINNFIIVRTLYQRQIKL